MTKHNKQRPIPQPKRMQLKENHSWKAPAGFKIVVLDRGAVSFNIAEKWFVAKMEPTFEMHNAAPPDDDARLSVTFFRTQPGIDWSGLPADALLQRSLQGVADRETVGTSAITRMPRTDIEVVWAEQRFVDPVEKPREAFTRVTLARGFDIHAIISFDYWVDQAAQFRPVWNEMVRSLQIGRVIADPTRGDTLH
ncbi:MAG: hypothetical protein GC179_15985 [Anaerolineaceae bacterium]|nr:hypothetical protein [Anaerolineaceae bacterium]